MNKYKKLLENRNFVLLFLGQWVSDLGSSINYLGLTWMILKVTGKVSDLGTMLILAQLPSIIIGPFAGVWSDRLNRKHIIVISDFCRGILSILMFMSTKVEHLFVIVLIQSIFDVFFKPSISGLIPKIVEKDDLMLASSFSGAASKISHLLGPSLGGVLIAILGAKAIFLLNGLSFIFSGITELFIEYKHEESKNIEKTTFFVDFKEGFEYILKKDIIKFVIVFFAVASLAFGSFSMLNAAYLKNEIKVSPELYGMAMTIFGVGALLGSVALAKIGEKISEIKLIIFGMGTYGIVYAIFGMASIKIPMLSAFAFCGAMGSIVNISYGVYLQRNVEESKLGRVFSIDMAIGNVLILVSIAMTGIFADRFSSQALIIFFGLFLTVIATIGYGYWNKKCQRGVKSVNFMNEAAQ